MATIRLENVSYVYGENTPFEKKALDNINLQFTPGIITGLMGHTGSGKSTLAQLLNGLLRPSAGRVLIDGEDIWSDPKKISKIRFRVGLVFQYPEYQLFEETVEKDIAFGPHNMKKSEAEITGLVKKAALFTGITSEMLGKSPFELSGGQKRRVAIAGVLAMDPEVIVLDEPAAGLDPVGREDILGGIRHYCDENKKTVILISHSMEDMARYADELVVMNKGSIMLNGSVAEVFKNSDKIEASGLSLPQIAKLMNVLNQSGLPVSSGIYTVADAYKAIRTALTAPEARFKDKIQ
ncbi:MAG: energy-coupling factor transporter ATPase [Oscillospiraceae bacterium]|nr:energy-coupling factor transporter ATPase [Oscillospiraceae bacterium]